MFDQRLKPLNEMIHFHGPQGVAFTSGEHMQLAASKNVAMNAGGDFSSGSLGNTAVLAGEQIGLFARSGSLTLNASEGPVQIQAQNGEMHISAEQKLSLVSASDMLFAGKKKVTLIGGGSYLIIEGGKIEYGTDTTYTRKVKHSATTGSTALDANIPEMPMILPALSCGPNAAYFRVSDALTGNEDMEFTYQIQTPTGAIQGRTNSALTNTINSDSEENVVLDYVYQIRAGIR
ncbi:Uncharacterized protein conserved in bacteria [Raoultella terrigena]|nr:Uncharacterized protein conserved in bacteria [Raoultella terrigena]